MILHVIQVNNVVTNNQIIGVCFTNEDAEKYVEECMKTKHLPSIRARYSIIQTNSQININTNIDTIYKQLAEDLRHECVYQEMREDGWDGRVINKEKE